MDERCRRGEGLTYEVVVAVVVVVCYSVENAGQYMVVGLARNMPMRLLGEQMGCGIVVIVAERGGLGCLTRMLLSPSKEEIRA